MSFHEDWLRFRQLISGGVLSGLQVGERVIRTIHSLLQGCPSVLWAPVSQLCCFRFQAPGTFIRGMRGDCKGPCFSLQAKVWGLLSIWKTSLLYSASAELRRARTGLKECSVFEVALRNCALCAECWDPLRVSWKFDCLDCCPNKNLASNFKMYSVSFV